MSWVTYILVFFVIWWTVIFTVLPMGVRRIENPPPGTDRGAPEKPQLLRKAIVCTAITSVLWVCWYIVWVVDVFSFRK